MAIVKLGERPETLGSAAFGGGGGGGAASAQGSVLVTGNTTEAAAGGAGIFVPHNFGTSAVLGPKALDFSLSSQAAGELRYDGTGTLDMIATVAISGLSGSGAGGQLYAHRMVKNATVLPEALETIIQFIEGQQRMMVMQVPIIGIVNGDLIRAEWVDDEGTTFGFVATSFTFRIDALVRLAAQTHADAANIVPVSAAYQALNIDDIISATGTFTVTLPAIATAIKPVTIQCVSGLITLAGDATIQAPTTVSAGSSVTVFPAGGQWFHM